MDRIWTERHLRDRRGSASRSAATRAGAAQAMVTSPGGQTVELDRVRMIRRAASPSVSGVPAAAITPGSQGRYSVRPRPTAGFNYADASRRDSPRPARWAEQDAPKEGLR